MPKLPTVPLTAEPRELLQTRLRHGGLPARVRARLRTLLCSDDGLPDTARAERLETSPCRIQRTRKRFASGGRNRAWAVGSPRRRSCAGREKPG